jgi:hypothetical protein
MAGIARANGVELEIVKRNHKKGDRFVLQAKRWVVKKRSADESIPPFQQGL